MPNDYIPNNDDALKTWLENFAAQIGAHAEALGISTAEELATVADGAVGAIIAKNSARNSYQQAVAQNQATIDAAISELRRVIARAKTAGGYTEAIGEALDIVAPESGFNPETYKAEITSAKGGGGEVVIKFRKARGQLDGVNVYSRLAGETAWRKLAFDSSSPYFDTAPLAQAGQPEVREYRVRGVIRDEEIGEFSDVASATVS